MALTLTTPLELGFSAPEFELPDVVSGRKMTLDDVRGEKATLMMFICNHCPYVIHVRSQLIQLARDYQPKGVGFAAVSSNDAVRYPDDSPEKMKQIAEEMDFPFPYLYDESQEVAKAYTAACTPDFALFDRNLKCVYRGRLDGSTPGNDEPLSGADMRRALDAVLNNQMIDWQQEPSMGCSIKWKEKNQ
jgi:peroxiredoxin